jgi:valyl-tRNA synthetase
LATAGNTHQQEIRLSLERIEQMRNFANKLWNVARFILGNQAQAGEGELQLTTADRWILSRANRVVEMVTADLEALEFSGPGLALYDFVWGELADWYVEIAKLRLYDGENSTGQYTARAVLWSLLDRVVRLLHPYMPFISEEIWQRLRLTGAEAARRLSAWSEELPESVMVARWPEPGPIDDQAEKEMALLMEIVRSVRTTRAEYRVEPGKWVPASIVAGRELPRLRGASDIISRLARLEPLQFFEVIPEKPAQAVALLVGDVTVYLPLAELTNVEAERARLKRELQQAGAALQKAEGKLANESFLSRAPESVVAQERERAEGLREKVRRLEERLDLLEA